MVHSKKDLNRLATCLIAATLLLTCEKVPDYCGKGVWYNPDFEFCDGTTKKYDLCGGYKYNPRTEGCIAGTTVGTVCADRSVVKLGTPCGGYTLSVGAAPENGGTVTGAYLGKTNFSAGDLVALYAAPEEGYRFIGWAGSENTPNASLPLTMDGNKSLIAMFSLGGAHSLVAAAFPREGGAVSVGGGAAGAEVIAEYGEGDEVTVRAEAAAGYAFTGWSGASNSTSPSVKVTIGSNNTLVAIFKPNVYTFIVNANPEDGGTVFVDGGALAGASSQEAGARIEAIAHPSEGYAFIGWSGAAGGASNPVEINVTSSGMTLTANFQKGAAPGPGAPDVYYSLETNSSPPSGGTVVRSPEQTRYGAGSQVYVSATPASGYTFSHWSGASTSTSSSITVTLNANTSLTAVFELTTTEPPPTTYTLTVNASPSSGGIVAPAGESSHQAGAQVSVSAAAADGYVFSHWSGASSSLSSSIAVTMSGNLTLTANFQTIQIETGSFVYDGQTYKTVKIGNQWWMAENLNYAIPATSTDSSWCYGDDNSNCTKYGRLYNWYAATNACPSGWKLPTNDDWDILVDDAGGSSVAGKALKSKTGWDDDDGESGNGTDEFGFSALPGGNRNDSDGSFNVVVGNGYWWSATEYGSGNAYYRDMDYNHDDVYEYSVTKSYGFSVRCVAQD